MIASHTIPTILLHAWKRIGWFVVLETLLVTTGVFVFMLLFGGVDVWSAFRLSFCGLAGSLIGFVTSVILLVNGCVLYDWWRSVINFPGRQA